MSKAVLLSIKPQYCEPIASCKKTVEVRKTRPKIDVPFKCYIYQTKMRWLFNLLRTAGLDNLADRLLMGLGKVIGEFVCDGIISHCEMANADIAEQQGCIRREKLFKYAGGKELYGWDISDLVIYDKPKELSEFLGACHKEFGEDCVLSACKHVDYTDLGKEACDRRITRPPQSWCYVEEID